MKKIKIDKKYKADLVKRFNLRRAKLMSHRKGLYYVIQVGCPLCRDYFNYGSGRCDGCPFEKLESNNRVKGCEVFIDKFIKKKDRRFWTCISTVWWKKEDDKIARRQIRVLKEEAKKLLVFV